MGTEGPRAGEAFHSILRYGDQHAIPYPDQSTADDVQSTTEAQENTADSAYNVCLLHTQWGVELGIPSDALQTESVRCPSA